ncbi:hypothetical protein ACF5W4_01450 [Bacillota bacterium Lsc_1132]
MEKNNPQNQYIDKDQDAIENRVNQSYDKMVQDVRDMIKETKNQYS